ncbi:MAG: DUF885 domain-containing protein [Steroidobacteraceae bacterium]
MNARTFSLAGFLALLALASPAGADENARAADFYERVQAEYYESNPIAAAFQGMRLRYGEWNDGSEAGEEQRLAMARRHSEQLQQDIDREKLDAQGQLSYDLFLDQQRRRIEGWPWRLHGYVFDHRSGPHSWAPAFLINTHRVESEQDARDYVSRLRGILVLVADALERASRAEEQGILPPRWVFPQIVDGARNVITGRPFDDSAADSPLLADFRTKLGRLQLDEAQAAALMASAERAMLEFVEPAYEAVIAWASAAEARASGDDGVWKLPDGEAYYQQRLVDYTTTSLTAEEIHQIGLREVARIHAEMRELMGRVGFKGSLQEFFEFIRSDERFYYPDTDEGRAAYLAEATRMIEAMRERLPELFHREPKAPMVVKAVEPFREASAGKAFYQRPAPDGSRPGVYYVNLYRMRDMPKTEMESLAYHEGIPGHHMQLALSIEQEDLPMFRRQAGYTAYTEGWGLYSERLPREIGFYQDPYSDFGRLTLELIRAVRLVVDTGLHAKRWTREQVIQYHLDNTPLPEGSVVRATERYIVTPGQATAYMIGQLKLLELRKRATDALGEAFDVRDFHERVLESGPVPLDVLERRIDEWIASASR